jgi:hypothetical protein
MDSSFTFTGIEKQYRSAIDAGYNFLTCQEYVEHKHILSPLTVVNRVDIDFSVKKARRLLSIFDSLAIKATFFVRLHAVEYNPFSFESYLVLKAIRDSGHEIGYHSEVIDQAAIWNEDPADCLRRDVDLLNRLLEIKITGVASHGGMTGLNNLDFWKGRKAEHFGLLYEAYDKEPTFNLFQEALYVSDSEWTRWKCYDKGTLCNGDKRSFGEHIFGKPALIYLLIHPDTYHDRHCYE